MPRTEGDDVDHRQANKAAAVRFIRGFNDDDWDAVREVVAPGFVFHHPVGGTVEAGPEGMISTWAGFKELSPDSWHPIPIMIADDDHVAVLLPTYGTFTGQGEHSPPPTGGRLDYGMVNMVRFDDSSRLAEMWFGMDSLVEMQQMGVAPTPPADGLSPAAQANLDRFTQEAADLDRFDNVVAFDDVVVAMGPVQNDTSATSRHIEVHRFDPSAELVYHHSMLTDPPYGGDLDVDGHETHGLVERWIATVLNDHDSGAVDDMVTPHVLIHATAMPCECDHHGPSGVRVWLEGQWAAFGELSITDHRTVASGDIAAVRWSAQGLSLGHFMGLPPTGEPIEFTGVSMYRVEDDRIAEIWDTRNTLGILHQLNPDLAGHHHHH